MHDYLIWSIRMQAWVSTAGTGTSEITQAKVFSRNAAFTFCVKQRGHQGELNAIPVHAADIKQLQEETPHP